MKPCITGPHEGKGIRNPEVHVASPRTKARDLVQGVVHHGRRVQGVVHHGRRVQGVVHHV